MRKKSISVAASVCIMAAAGAYPACIESDTADPDAYIPASATQVGDGPLFLDGGEPSELPPPSESEAAPVITAVTAAKTGENSFTLFVEVDANAPIELLYLDFGEMGVYATSAFLAGASSYTACDALFDTEGYTCTEACKQACDCLYCPENAIEDSVEGACATNCSILVHEGGLSAAPYNGSEATFANVIYNGYEGNPGVLDGTGCDASTCEEAAAESQVIEVGFYVQEWPDLVFIGSAVAQSAPQGELPSLTSGKYAPGNLVIDDCHHGECF